MKTDQMPPPVHSPNYRKQILIVLPILLVLSATFSLFHYIHSIELRPADGIDGYRIWLRPTRDKNRNPVAKKLRERIHSLTIDGTTARVVPAELGAGMGNVLLDSTGNMIVSGFTLTGPGDKFAIGGYHGSTVFTVRKITPDSVTLRYSEFFMGNNGFGSHVVTEDTGEFTLGPVSNPWPAQP